tara:strand:+ start:973 stop:1656 length:684 start_codon:yes stop_codon:yes gene_type:complete
MPLTSQLPFDFALHNEFTFNNFYVTEPNRELLVSLQTEVLPEAFYFIWGASGSGKSHLLQAACALHQNAVYLPLKLFFQYGEDVLDGLHQLDLLCIDDVQLGLGNPLWEEKLFALFNNCQINNTHLLISSSLAPLQLNYVLADLQSRFNSGVTFQLHELDERGKMAALQGRAEAAGIPLKEDVINYIYLRSERSTQKLFSVLAELDKLSLAEKRKITIPFVKSIMQW